MFPSRVISIMGAVTKKAARANTVGSQVLGTASYVCITCAQNINDGCSLGEYFKPGKCLHKRREYSKVRRPTLR